MAAAIAAAKNKARHHGRSIDGPMEPHGSSAAGRVFFSRPAAIVDENRCLTYAWPPSPSQSCRHSWTPGLTQFKPVVVFCMSGLANLNGCHSWTSGLARCEIALPDVIRHPPIGCKSQPFSCCRADCSPGSVVLEVFWVSMVSSGGARGLLLGDDLPSAACWSAWSGLSVLWTCSWTIIVLFRVPTVSHCLGSRLSKEVHKR